jgi:D-sedoheptulose 7-phosphate isomerase
MGESSANTTSSDYMRRVQAACSALDMKDVAEVGAVLLNARASNSMVFTVGNGGSAATASHMATDFGVGSHSRGLGLRTVCLCDSASVMTATANDLSYERVFAEQIELLACPGDVLVVISASGNSPNILQAVHVARTLKLVCIALTGFNGGALRGIVDHNIHVPTAVGDYGPVEDVHLIINHMLTEIMRRETPGRSDGAP